LVQRRAGGEDQMNGSVGQTFVLAAMTWLFSACNNQPNAAAPTQSDGGAASGEDGSQAGMPSNTSAPTFHTSFAAFAPESSVPDGSAGAASGAVVAPFGVSTICGDAIIGADEQCDDGPGAAIDACTSLCRTRDQPASQTATKIDRYQGFGRHPLAGLDGGFISSYVEFPTDEAPPLGEPAIGATLFNVWGQPQHHVNVSEGASPIELSNPVAAALPGGAYAVAWTDFDSDGSNLGIALRRVSASGNLGPLLSANANRTFTQEEPDLLWTGGQLVVAWEDYADANNGPDLRYRTFDADLNPLADDLTLAASEAPEAAVALASFGNGWAAAYREGVPDGTEYIVIKAGDASFRVGPVLGGSPDDKPALATLDTSHLLVVFSEGTDPGATGIYNTPRLRYALLDTAGSTTPGFLAVNPLGDVYVDDESIAQLSPSLLNTPNGIYLAWSSVARPKDAAGDEVWLKHLAWSSGAPAQLDLSEQEVLIPHSCEGRGGHQRTPALAFIPDTTLPPSGALAVAWDDYSRSLGANAGAPDVVVQYVPMQAEGAQSCGAECGSCP
jgi:cysteine-rich repeat protein